MNWKCLAMASAIASVWVFAWFLAPSLVECSLSLSLCFFFYRKKLVFVSKSVLCVFCRFIYTAASWFITSTLKWENVQKKRNDNSFWSEIYPFEKMRWAFKSGFNEHLQKPNKGDYLHQKPNLKIDKRIGLVFRKVQCSMFYCALKTIAD